MLNIPLLNTDCDAAYVPRKTVIGKLQPIEIEDIEISNVSWTKEHLNTRNSLVELPGMLPASSFQPDQNNLKQLILL